MMNPSGNILVRLLLFRLLPFSSTAGAAEQVNSCKSHATRGVWGHAPPGKFSHLHAQLWSSLLSKHIWYHSVANRSNNSKSTFRCLSQAHGEQHKGFISQ